MHQRKKHLIQRRDKKRYKVFYLVAANDLLATFQMAVWPYEQINK